MDILKSYQNRLKQSYDYATPHWTRAIDNYKHYLGRIDTGNTNASEYPFHSKMSMSVSYEIVETIMPRIIGRDPEFTSVAVESEDIPFERAATMAVDMGYNNPKLELLGEPIYLKLQRMVKEMLITGNAVGRPFWRRQTTKQVKYYGNLAKAGIKDDPDLKKLYKMAQDIGDKVTFTKKLVDSPFLDDFDLRHLPFFMFFGDFGMIEPGRMRYKIERDYMTVEELLDEASRFGYDKPVVEEIIEMSQKGAAGFTPDVNKDFMQSYNDLFNNIDKQSFSTDDDKVPLLLVDKMWMGDRVAVFVNEKFNLTQENGMPNPYDIKQDPFIFGHDIVIPHSYFSLGEVDAIKKLEDGANDLLNMRMDNLVQAMLNFWLVNPNLVDPSDEFQPIPNSITSVLDIDKAVRVINGANVTPTAYKEVEDMVGMIQRITGVNDYVKGAEGETLAGRTYGGLRLVQEAANARFIVKSRLFEKVTLKALGYFILEMSKQFIDKERVRRRFGEDGNAIEKRANPAELRSIKGLIDINVIPNSNKAIDEQAEAMKLNALADRVTSGKGPFAEFPPEVFDRFLLKYLPLYGIHDAFYWVRLIRENREKMEKERTKAEKAMKQQSAIQPPQLPQPPVPPQTPMGFGRIQSDQITNQAPDPLAAILNAEALPPPIQSDENFIA